MALSKKSLLSITAAGPDNPRGHWPYAPIKPSSGGVKTTAEFDIVNCNECGKLVTIPKGQTIEHHYLARHPNMIQEDLYSGLYDEEPIGFNDEPTAGGERSGKLCPKCKERGEQRELAFYDEHQPEKGLWPYYQCESCGYWQDAPEELDEPEGEELSYEDLYQDCPRCGSEMEEFKAETNTYWVCDKCGNVEMKDDPEKPKSKWRSLLQKPVDWFSDIFGKYEKRDKIQANQITPNIWLGDVANGWYMRDKGTGKPFDAILNVSQHSYTAPPDVEYVHLPIEEHAIGAKYDAERVQDLNKAAKILQDWTDQGKQIYLHCSEGMNRSPSVLALYMMRQKLDEWGEKLQALNMNDREALYDLIVEDINKKRVVAYPYGHMEDALRKSIGLPVVAPKTFKPTTKGGWWAPEKQDAAKYQVGQQVHWTNPSTNKIETGTVISAPRISPKEGLYWIKDQMTGTIVTLREKDIVTKKKQQPARYYPGEKGVLQTHPKFPPAGGIVKKKKKKKKALSKKGFSKMGVMRRGGTQIISRFLRRAIKMDELYNFYAIMQLPPQFFQAFPKWDAYAKEIVSNIAGEYAKYLEQLCRTEGEETHSCKGGDDGESEHDHEWEPYDEDNHQCSECGDTDTHDDWSDADETGHTCGTCGHGAPHEFDSDHECTACGGSYPHNWVLDGDQEFKCETNDEGQGCGSETDRIEADDEAPNYGDFWEEQHQHNFLPFPDTYDSDAGVRCTLCGRAFIDESGETQTRLPGVEKQRVNDPSPKFLYNENIVEKKDKLRAEHNANPDLHEFKFERTDNWAKYENGNYISGNIYECYCGEEITLFGEDEPQTGRVINKQPAPKSPEWQEIVVNGNCPNCSATASSPVKLVEYGPHYVRCPSCSRTWDHQGNRIRGVGTTAKALSLRQLIAAEPALKWPDPRRRRVRERPQRSQELPESFEPEVEQGQLFQEPFVPPSYKRPQAPQGQLFNEEDRKFYKEVPQVSVDTSKWFDFYVQDPDLGKLVPWSEMRKNYKPSQWRLFEKSIIENPESVLTMIGPGASGELEESVDQEKLAKFKNLIALKRNLMSMTTQDYLDALGRFEDYRNQMRTDADDIFLAITGLKSLYDNKNPDDKDSLTYNQIRPELSSAWRKYMRAMETFDVDTYNYYQENQAEAPKPEWSAQAAAASNQVTIAQGTGSSPGIATGRVAITAAMALEFAAQGKVILVRPETTPDDIAAMKASAGFLTAHGGPTAHAAIVARQMGKPCVTGAGFSVMGDAVNFGGDKIVEVGKTITIDGRSGAVMVNENVDAAASDPIEEKHVEPPQEGENWDDEFEKILSLDEYMKKSKGQDYDYDSIKSMDLIDLAQAFNTDLVDGAYGGQRWGLASIRAKQLQEAIELGMPWKYLGMLVDQINTLQHNSGNIFAHKPWPGKPGNWITEVLDTKGSEHALTWMEMEKNQEDFSGKSYMFTDETRKMLRDYRLWARREGYPSIYGTDITGLTPQQMREMMEKERQDVRRRREKEMSKWSRARVVVTKTGNTVTAFHKIAGARLVVYVDQGRQEIYSTKIADHWKGKGIMREMADAVAKCL